MRTILYIDKVLSQFFLQAHCCSLILFEVIPFKTVPKKVIFMYSI